MERLYKKLSENALLNIIKNSFISLMPLTIIVSIFVLLVNFPVKTFVDFADKFTSGFWTGILTNLANAFNQFIGLYLVVATSSSYAKYFEKDMLQWSLNALFVYLCFSPQSSSKMLISSFANSGIFFSMICALLASGVLHFFSNKDLKIKLNESLPQDVGNSFNFLLPISCSIVSFLILKIIFSVFGMNNISDTINRLIQAPIMNLGSTLPAVVIINFGITFLWFFGFNGSYLFNSIMNPIYFSLNMENLTSISHNQAPPNIITGTFQSLFINYGGSGSTLALIIAILLFSKEKEKRNMGRLAFIPSLFNINEPIVYGLPVILNFRVLTPFLLCPLINTIIAYYSMYFGFVLKTNGIQIPWTTPPIISGFLSSGITGALLQVTLIVIDVSIYSFFVRTRSR